LEVGENAADPAHDFRLQQPDAGTSIRHEQEFESEQSNPMRSGGIPHPTNRQSTTSLNVVAIVVFFAGCEQSDGTADKPPLIIPQSDSGKGATGHSATDRSRSSVARMPAG